MRFLLGSSLVIGGIGGMALSFLGNVVVNSSTVGFIDGTDLSVVIGLFGLVAFANGLYTLFLTD